MSRWGDSSTPAAMAGSSGNWDSGATGWNSGDASGDHAANGFDSGAVDSNRGFPLASGDARNDVIEGGDDGCRNCGQAGHFARDCTEPRKMGACFNCGEEGHSKADCTKPRVFKGTCNECGQEGHASRDCPTKPKICKNCSEEGHEALECKNKKALDNSNVADKTEEEAWEMLKTASDEKDLDDFKDAVKILVKAVPGSSYQQLEAEFRKREFKVYIIAMEKDIGDTWTNVDLQGEIGKKFAVGYYFSANAQRPSLAPKWPTSPEENVERLADAGVPMDRGVEKCHNCNEVGHTARACTQDKVEIERATVSCALCGEAGHRVRDCTEERQKPREPRACKVCEETDHIAKDCPKREKRFCRKCGDENHMVKDCDILKCNNCDEIGHEFRDCTAPRDWSRVKCRNCGEMGHTVRRCKEPIKEDENAPPATGGGGFGPVDTSKGGSGWDDGAATGGSAHNDWEVSGASVSVGGGGW